MSEQDEQNRVTIAVLNHYSVSNGHYDKQMFTISVQVGVTIEYVIERSYVDFVEFNRRLRRNYSDFLLPTLPLYNWHYVEITLESEEESWSKNTDSVKAAVGALKNFQDSLVSNSPFLRNFLNSKHSNPFVIKDFSEKIAEKTPALTEYIQQLLEFPEVANSKEFHTFFDNDVSSMIDDTTKKKCDLSTIDALLSGTKQHNIIVGYRPENFYFTLPPDSYLIWKFTTANFDIGFSVEMNGEVKIPMTRHKANESAVSGALKSEVKGREGLAILKFDNSYSKLRSKNLTWCARVVSEQEYTVAEEQSVAMLQTKNRYTLQRIALKKATAAVPSKEYKDCEEKNKWKTLQDTEKNKEKQITVTGSTKTQIELEEKLKKFESEIEKLQTENTELVVELEKLEKDVEDLTVEKESVENLKDQISSSWDFTVQQLDVSDSRVKELTLFRQTVDPITQNIEVDMNDLSLFISQGSESSKTYVDHVDGIVVSGRTRLMELMKDRQQISRKNTDEQNTEKDKILGALIELSGNLLDQLENTKQKQPSWTNVEEAHANLLKAVNELYSLNNST